MNKEKRFSIYDICEIAILVALALLLDKLKISIGSTGGSINLCAVPLIIISVRKGFLKGLLSISIIFSVLSCLLDGYGIQFLPFDYVIAFSGYSFVGLFYLHCFGKVEKKEIRLLISIILGLVVSFFTRMIGHILSSMIFYNYNFFAAIIYNIVYVGISIAGTLAVSLVIIKPLIVINDKYSKK